MTGTTLQTITELLNEEKWTRATINNYTINNFKELDDFLEKTADEETDDEVRQLCNEHLSHTKNSIIALYISGLLALRRQLIDDSYLIKLINIFSDNHKWKVVEYLCNRILDFGENKFALQTLAQCYEHENEIEKKYQVWERLTRVDFEEADIVRLIAEKKEKDGDLESAVEYYKKAVHRYINKKLFNNIKDIWHKLIEFMPEDTEFFFHAEKKVAQVISREKASKILEDLLLYYKKEENWDKCIVILKRILSYDAKNIEARNEITECYIKKYKGHSHLEEYIKLSNLTQNWRNVHDAIADFEKHISFDEGNFVYHRSWGIGLIRSIKSETVTIDFSRKRDHKMSLKMAVNALVSLSKDHIWVIKSILPKEKIREKVKTDTLWALKTIIKSHDGVANIKQIKSELVPSILSPGEWTAWSTEARKILKTNPLFGNLPEKVDHFVVRDNPITFEEKSFNRFKAEKSFFNRVKIIREFLDHSDPESELFGEMYDYFTGFIKSYTHINELTISSFLIISRIIKEYPYLNPGVKITIKDLINNIDDFEELFSKIEDMDIKRDFLESVKKYHPDWANIFIILFPHYFSRYIIDELESKGKTKQLIDLFNIIIDEYRDNREAFIWLARNIEKDLFEERYGIKHEKVLIGLIHLLDITFREISNKREVSFNRKLNKQISNLLFKEELLKNHFLNADEYSVSRLFTLVDDIKDLDPSIKIELKHKIVERFPDFKFYGEKETESVSRGFIVTRKSYEQKQQQLHHIVEVEIPENAKEIGIASEMGDLRENAEYKAGKEKQEMLNITATKLKEELDKATIFSHDEIDTSKISFGTKVTLLNLNKKCKEVYIFLGPWESEPSENIISYLSPFGNQLWNHKEGDEIEFSINERDYHFKVESIEQATL